MPWIVGIDEAGYGPNLGPFVMTSVAYRVPESLAGADGWEVLQPAVRRDGDADDGRMLVEDSKVLYSTHRGLLDLELSVLAFLAVHGPLEEGVVHELAERLCPACHADLHAEPWYTGTSALPVEADGLRSQEMAERLSHTSLKRQVSWGLVRSVVVCPARFNALLNHWGSKGAVLGYALRHLLAANRTPDEGQEPVWFVVDKHGGRNTYAAMLQDALAEGMVVAHEEGRERSDYSVLGLEREVRLTFQPRADAEHFGVALASMVSKYLREVLMREFNQFWQARVPDLKPTAGYPGDALRFWNAIRPVAERLAIPEAAMWRRK
jgi:ribonuclease HII